MNYTANGTNFCTRTTFPVACVPPSGSLFPLGTRSVCCTNVTDGFTNFCCFQVTVNADTTPPVINCPTNMVVFCSPSNGTKVTWPVGATDLCAQAATAVACVPASGSVFPLGGTNVVCTATDLAGNTNACTFRVCVLAIGCYLKNPSFELLIGFQLTADQLQYNATR